MHSQNPVFIPGPTNIPEVLRKACDMPTLDHRSAAFGRIFGPAVAGVKKVLMTTAGEIFLFPSTGTGGWDSGTHDWTNYTTTYSLGVGGGATLRSKYTAVYSARTALRNAVLQASLASNAATDTFRPLRTWDFSDRDPMGWVPGSITVAAAASPSDKTARKWTTTTSGVLGKFTGEPNLTDASSGSPVAVAFSFAGKPGAQQLQRMRRSGVLPVVRAQKAWRRRQRDNMADGIWKVDRHP